VFPPVEAEETALLMMFAVFVLVTVTVSSSYAAAGIANSPKAIAGSNSAAAVFSTAVKVFVIISFNYY